MELPEGLGRGFDSADPERGYSPYISKGGPPVHYPTLDEKEDDDHLHNPDEFQDKRPGWREYCGFGATWLCLLCGILLLLGLFLGFPIVRALGHLRRQDTQLNTVERLSSHTYPILGGIRTSLIDPDTPAYAMTRKSVLGQGNLMLVFSDEFNVDGRTFYEGDDQFWQAADFHYAATNDLEWYDPDAITTANGTLQIRMQAIKNHGLDYRSGMLQSWNKMCFKGGVIEVSVSLAGPAGVSGAWPGIWTLGNLARPGYQATTDGIWPYSYDYCDVGITPNQSSADGLSFLPGQRLANCVCNGEDHPSLGTGRGAPEIDVLEGTAQPDLRIGVVTQSSQVAPFDVWYQANLDFMSIRDQEITQLNGWKGGPYQQAISGVTMLNNNWYDGKQYQKYAFEYIPGKEDGEIAWFVGDFETFRMKGGAIGPNGNIDQRDVSREPMSIILNLGLSNSWTWIDWTNLMPHLVEGTTMYIDYVRIYQKEGEESITCDPTGYPTTSYIKEHPKAYQNFNITSWDDAGYPWPKNRLLHGCD
ncbi:beta-glucan synthesis-associated [Sphaerosporella brunnea]|uniref:Beta-glucan synthesis-associated n=1 Tax=Sphaerosporella brunnea TaxID=1250544 RepID=A0A5J5EVP0_9PEZI|nr:beta-glucan synthesis-associated [Sphaerosporella brunnea]